VNGNKSDNNNDGNIISVRNLHKSFHGVHVLKGLNLDVREGQLVSVIGRSGCGKTTLLRCLNCLEILDEGSITVTGINLQREKPVNGSSNFKKQTVFDRINNFATGKQIPDEEFRLKARAIRTNVGMLFQGLNLFPHLTVIDNIIKAPVIVKGEDSAKAEENALRLLKKVGLLDYLHRYPYQLSGGQAQRVAIARALAMSPQVMLYDEPTAALDPELIEEVLQVMRKLHEEGMTQVVVTHAIRFARTASDVVCYMEDGTIIESSAPDKLFNSPEDERTGRYLSMFKD
jgi:polar amino acid transport system ATP-binding protein